jgi:hypothetical protein
MRERTLSGGWGVLRDSDPDAEIFKRRFGRNHSKPCKNPRTLICAMPECQYANECRASPLALEWARRDEEGHSDAR